jgi:hypothetical protein
LLLKLCEKWKSRSDFQGAGFARPFHSFSPADSFFSLRPLLFAHRFTAHLDAVGIVHKTVKDAVSQMAISGHKTQAVFKRYNIVSGRDIKEAASKLESYLGKQKTAKPVATRRKGNGDNSGTIGQPAPILEKRARVN